MTDEKALADFLKKAIADLERPKPEPPPEREPDDAAERRLSDDEALVECAKTSGWRVFWTRLMALHSLGLSWTDNPETAAEKRTFWSGVLHACRHAKGIADDAARRVEAARTKAEKENGHA